MGFYGRIRDEKSFILATCPGVNFPNRKQDLFHSEKASSSRGEPSFACGMSPPLQFNSTESSLTSSFAEARLQQLKKFVEFTGRERAGQPSRPRTASSGVHSAIVGGFVCGSPVGNCKSCPRWCFVPNRGSLINCTPTTSEIILRSLHLQNVFQELAS
ncbi:hypothetical protein pipiens_019026 [Culex pipiens pipiens]|uniref:Uncharacterized protein n=1 Tax=Culex pipiens pipiens TaxID=38569 RepID=A0ABD1E144_CULPP